MVNIFSRIEKGREACLNSPTLDEGWILDTLSEAVCENGIYDESVVKDEVDKIKVFDTFILIIKNNDSQEKRLF